MFQKVIAFFKKLFSKSAATNTEVVALPPPVTNYSPTPTVTLGQVRGATDLEITMISQATKLLQGALKTAKFKELVLSTSFTETNNLTNEEIYEKLCANVLVVNVVMFTGSFRQNHIWRTVGLDTKGDDFVYANRYFVQDAKVLASLILHEMCHGLGFGHYGEKSTSVPYRMNDIIEECMNGI